MKIKKYKAASLREALLLVKAELGDKAVILNTRKTGTPLFGGEKFEVTAALDESAPADSLPAADSMSRSVETYSPQKIRRAANGSPTTVIERTPAPIPKAPDGLTFDHFAAPRIESGDAFETLRTDLSRMRHAVHSIAEKSGAASEALPAGLRAVRESLEQNEIAPEHIDALISAMRAEHPPEKQKDDVWMRRSLFRRLEGALKTAGPIARGLGKARKIALVGPTGVGKTTTIAKLAAHFRLKEGCRVALIAADNYRMAAVEQIQQFASIAEIPLEVVYTEEEMKQALAKFAAFDLVFIDTAGRSQRNTDQMNDLRRTLNALEPDEVHLTVSVSTRMKDLQGIERKYAEIGYHRLLFTKLDETLSYGPIYNLLLSSGKPVSYVSTGQNIPDDIALASGRALANLIAGGGLQ